MLLVCIVCIKCRELNQKRSDYLAVKCELEEKIAFEEERAISIKEYETYTQTKAYVEDIARDKLGLVYEGEILFKDENQSN